MRALYLLRHSLTEANIARLYCGRTDLPLAPTGVALADKTRRKRPIPPCGLYASSGMKRADETLRLLTGRKPGLVLSGLREMDFGAFEMHSYDELKQDADYLRWIGDETGDVPCPGGESTNAFARRVRAAGDELLGADWDRAAVVCHGGVIVQLMRAWFPEEQKHFYEWQPAACGGWRIDFDGNDPLRFESL